MQKLFTKEIENALKKYPIYSQYGKGDNAKVIARFFGGCYTAYILEGDQDGTLYGVASLGCGFEYGYISRDELEKTRYNPIAGFNATLPLERDISIKPLQSTLGECMARYKESFMYL